MTTPVQAEKPSASRHARCARASLLVLPPLVALVAALWHGPYPIDDAYITFRYAHNLATGHGIVFNHGEAVLGTTTPLLTLILGLLGWCGADIPTAARVLGIIAATGVVTITQLLALRVLPAIPAAAVALVLALHPDLAFTANSGMETGLSMAAVYGALLMALQGRFTLGGLAGGAAFLLRPDGALALVLVGGVALLRAPRRAWRPAVAGAAVVLPWLVYAAATYGSVVPHSVAAKQSIHPDTPGNILSINFQRLTLGLELTAVCGLAVIGLLRAGLRKSPLLLVALWMVLYLAGLSASRIRAFFPWYVSPLFPGLLLLAGFGLTWIVQFIAFADEAARNRQRVANVLSAVLLIGLAGIGIYQSSAWRRVCYQAVFGDRTPAYLKIADFLRPGCAPGDVVFVGEVGAIAYGLPQQVILDSAGINSPAVLRARQADREQLLRNRPGVEAPEGSPAWVMDVIERFHPRYIITYKLWLHMNTLGTDPWLTSAYRRVRMPGLEDYVILERIGHG